MFSHCLPNDGVTHRAPGAGSKKAVTWDLGESSLVFHKKQPGREKKSMSEITVEKEVWLSLGVIESGSDVSFTHKRMDPG